MKQQAAQVYFPLSMYLEIKQIALQEKKSMAAWVREVVEKEVKKVNSKRTSLIDMPTYSWASDDPYVSDKVDDILYGDS